MEEQSLLIDALTKLGPFSLDVDSTFNTLSLQSSKACFKFLVLLRRHVAAKSDLPCFVIRRRKSPRRFPFTRPLGPSLQNTPTKI